MPRVTLYVPKDVFEQMQLRHDVNWSAVFQEAVKAQTTSAQRDWIILGRKNGGTVGHGV